MKGEEGAMRQRIASYLKGLMSDAELYGWEFTTFHGIWLNQLEQDRYTWMDDDEKLRFHQALV